jgi:acetoin:2,6-dichlorophenolindophenol oxidoreductase subunit alpha
VSEPDREIMQEMLRRMWLIRRFEEASARLVEEGEIGGEVHLAIGQEAETVGSCLALRTDDYMTGNHRSHGHPIAKGSDVRGLMAELIGKATGVCKGKGGSMHLADFSVGSLGESGIVASAMPVAVGAGLSAVMQNTDRVVLCFFGDGAVNEGAFHEAMNLAAIWKLPVIFLCENNEYAVTMPVKEVTAIHNDLVERACGYAGMESTKVDGQDVVAVYEATMQAVSRARRGDGPTFIEAKTYRFDEHAFALPMRYEYRSVDEVELYKQTRDPIQLFVNDLLAKQTFTSEELEEIERAATAEIVDAVAFAKGSPWPEPDAWSEDMYAEPIALR